MVNTNLDWSKFPEWANWYSVDIDGEVTVWENKPKRIVDCFAWSRSGKFKTIDFLLEFDKNGDFPNWKKSLIERPK